MLLYKSHTIQPSVNPFGYGLSNSVCVRWPKIDSRRKSVSFSIHKKRCFSAYGVNGTNKCRSEWIVLCTCVYRIYIIWVTRFRIFDFRRSPFINFTKEMLWPCLFVSSLLLFLRFSPPFSLSIFLLCTTPPPLSLFVFRLGYAPQINECHLPTLLFIPVDRSANAGVNRKKSLKSSAKKKKQINRSTRSLAMIKTCVPTNRREWNTLYHTQHGFIIIIIIDTHCLALNSKPHIRKDCISGRTG